MDCRRLRRFDQCHSLLVADITVPEQFVVGVLRCWDTFMADSDRTLPWRELAPVFDYMNVVGALCAFDAAFRVIDRHKQPALRFGAVDCRALGMAEARFLSSLAALQRADVPTAGRVLTGALSRQGIYAVLTPLARIAATLDTQGHRLPEWQQAPAPADAGPAVATRPDPWSRGRPAYDRSQANSAYADECCSE